MAVMKKKPKPLRPDPTKANYKGTTGKNPVVKITKVTKPFRKPTVKNPTAPTAAGPRGGGVRVITKSETAMKKDKARSARTGTLPLTKTVTDSMKTSGKKSYKASTGNQKLIEGTQQIGKRGYTGLTAAEKKALTAKGGKPSKVAPKKKTEAPKQAKPKRRIFVGRGGGMRGGAGGGLFDQIK